LPLAASGARGPHREAIQTPNWISKLRISEDNLLPDDPPKTPKLSLEIPLCDITGRCALFSADSVPMWRGKLIERPQEEVVRIQATADEQGLMIIGISDHGGALNIVGTANKACQYLIGNPLTVIEMTRHELRVALENPAMKRTLNLINRRLCLGNSATPRSLRPRFAIGRKWARVPF